METARTHRLPPTAPDRRVRRATCVRITRRAGLFFAATALWGCSGAGDSDTDPPVETDTDVGTDTDTDVTSVPGPPWDLTVLGQGYQGGNGLLVRGSIADQELIQVATTQDRVEGGGFQLRFRDALDPDEPGFWVAWWIDLNPNDECGPGDVAFLEQIGSADEDLQRSHTFDANGIDPGACGGF